MEEITKLYKKIKRKYLGLSCEEQSRVKLGIGLAACALTILIVKRIRASTRKTPSVRIVALSEFLRKLRPLDKVEFRGMNTIVAPELGLGTLGIPGGQELVVKSIITKVRDFRFVPESSTVKTTVFNIVFPVALLYGWFRAVKSLIQPQDEAAFDGSKRNSLVPKTKFSDVVFSEKRELVEVVDFLNHPSRFRAIGAKLPRGVLLVGPSGSGKTLLARAVAGEANCAFLAASGSEFIETFVGKGAARVRSLFNEARVLAPCVVFIDELDALGRRDAVGVFGTNSAHEEYVHTLNQLLTELDGIAGNQSDEIVIIAATNRFEAIDTALLRPGRFDRHVWMKMPDVVARLEILRIHARDVNFENPLDVALKPVAEKTDDFSGADLANLVNEAVFFSLRRGARGLINAQDLTNALAKAKAMVLRRGSSSPGTTVDARVASKSVLELN